MSREVKYIRIEDNGIQVYNEDWTTFKRIEEGENIEFSDTTKFKLVTSEQEENVFWILAWNAWKGKWSKQTKINHQMKVVWAISEKSAQNGLIKSYVPVTDPEFQELLSQYQFFYQAIKKFDSLDYVDEEINKSANIKCKKIRKISSKYEILTDCTESIEISYLYNVCRDCQNKARRNGEETCNNPLRRYAVTFPDGNGSYAIFYQRNVKNGRIKIADIYMTYQANRDEIMEVIRTKLK